MNVNISWFNILVLNLFSMKLCNKTHHLIKFSHGSIPPNPSNKPLRGMQLAQTTKKLIPLANPAYAHGKIYFNSWGSNP